MTQIRTLHTKPLGDAAVLATPEVDEAMTLQSRAYEIFTDFTHYHPVTIDSDLSVTEAEALMQRAHVKLTLVINQAGSFSGVLSYGDLGGSRYQQLIGQGTAKEDIFVRDVMVHPVDLKAIAFEDLASASVEDVVATLQKEHRQHFLVLDQQAKIRGIFSASDIARRLHIPIDITQAPTFADICHAVYGHSPP